MLDTILNLVVRLYNETEGYLQDQAEVQLWYNRGYANGMVAALRAKGHEAELASRIAADPAGIHNSERLMPWGQAYHHGFEMGQREASEVLHAH